MNEDSWFRNASNICANHFTNNETAIITKANIFIGNMCFPGVKIKVIDYSPENTKKENKQNIIKFCQILLHGLYQEKSIVEMNDEIFEVYQR